jgi:hypothetical protein
MIHAVIEDENTTMKQTVTNLFWYYGSECVISATIIQQTSEEELSCRYQPRSFFALPRFPLRRVVRTGAPGRLRAVASVPLSGRSGAAAGAVTGALTDEKQIDLD